MWLEGKMSDVVKYKFVYKIYEVSQDGLLKEPRGEEYGRNIIIFDEYDTEEDALKAIEKEQGYETFIILKAVSVNYIDAS
jgi:spore coat polysaccharide biosynthesis predicted glycosyltransferase SpsG